MASRWLLCLTACCALFLASAVLRAGEPPQQASQPTSIVSPDRATLDRYCVTCHNSRTRTGGLALDTLDVDARRGRRGDMGESRPEASRPHDAAARAPAPG